MQQQRADTVTDDRELLTHLALHEPKPGDRFRFISDNHVVEVVSCDDVNVLTKEGISEDEIQRCRPKRWCRKYFPQRFMSEPMVYWALLVV